MDFRLATMKDLPLLKSVYKDIIQNMEKQQVCIWDDIYPCEFLRRIFKIIAFMYYVTIMKLFLHLFWMLQIPVRNQ